MFPAVRLLIEKMDECSELEKELDAFEKYATNLEKEMKKTQKKLDKLKGKEKECKDLKFKLTVMERYTKRLEEELNKVKKQLEIAIEGLKKYEPETFERNYLQRIKEVV